LILVSSFESLPVISVTSEHVMSDTSHIEDDVEVSSEMFWPNGERDGFMLHNGFETWGGSPSNPKKNFRLEFKGIYGATKLDFDIFKDDSYHQNLGLVLPARKFDKLLLRAGSQDGLNAEFGNENNAQYIRNRVIHDLMLSMGYASSHGRFVHLFVNKVYAGHYHLQERTDASFFESYYGGDKDDYEVYKGGEIWDGPYDLPNSIYRDLENHIDLNNPTAVAETNEYINLDQTAAYLLLMSYASGFDWSETRNSMGGTHITPGLGYRFIPIDMDFSLANGGIWHPNRASDVTFFNAPQPNEGPVPESLVSQLEFKIMMADKMQCHCYGDGVLTPAFVDSIYNLRIGEVEKSLIAESARWGDQDFSFVSGHIGVEEWDVNGVFAIEKQRVLDDYLPLRTNTLIQHYKTIQLASQLSAIGFNLNGGTVASGFQLELANSNPNTNIYYTTDGTDPRSIGGDISGSAMLYSGSITLSDGVVEVRARAKENVGSVSDIDHWSNMCPYTFIVGQEYSGIVFNEIHYNPNDSLLPSGEEIDGTNFEFLEIINSGLQNVNLNGMSVQSGIEYNFTEDINIPPGGFLVLAEDENWFQEKYGFSAYGQYSGKLSNGGETILLKDPFNNTVDSVTYDDGGDWNPAADEGFYSLALLQATDDNSLASSWQIQPGFYTPGEENNFGDFGAHSYSGIVINEIHYHPPDTIDANMNIIDGKDLEFIELKNISAADIDLSDSYFSDGVTYTFPENSILPAGGLLVLASNEVEFMNRYTFPAFGEYTGQLSNGGETIELSNSEGIIMDVINYDDDLPWPPEADGTDDNKSIALFLEDIDNDNPALWKIQCAARQTPNEENDLACYNCLAYEFLNNDDLTLDIYRAKSIETNGVVQNPNIIFYQVQDYAEFLPDFDIKPGAELEIMLHPCNN